MGLKVTGSFTAAIADAQKYGVISYERGIISVTEEYKLVKHSYTEEEKKERLTDLFLKPEVFQDLFNRFQGLKLPVEMLDKILIREFDVRDKVASRVCSNFVEGLKVLDLIDEDFFLRSNDLDLNKIKDSNVENEITSQIDLSPSDVISQDQKINSFENISKDSFKVTILGPRLNTTIELLDEDDLNILDATLNKIRKALKGSE